MMRTNLTGDCISEVLYYSAKGTCQSRLPRGLLATVLAPLCWICPELTLALVFLTSLVSLLAIFVTFLSYFSTLNY